MCTSPLRRLLPYLLGALVLVLCTAPAQAQESEVAADEADRIPYGSGMGLEILLTNNGFGLGGYTQRALSPATSLLIEASLGAAKAEREIKFFRFGSSFIPNKANYLLMLPLQVGVTHRLFRETIEDNFRPYLQVTAGPTAGWESPYYQDSNANGQYDQGERTYDVLSALPKGRLKMGAGGTIALGANFGFSKKVTQGVRLGYAFHYFFEGIQLLETEVQDAQHFFSSPTISLTFGKLF